MEAGRKEKQREGRREDGGDQSSVVCVQPRVFVMQCKNPLLPPAASCCVSSSPRPPSRAVYRSIDGFVINGPVFVSRGERIHTLICNQKLLLIVAESQAEITLCHLLAAYPYTMHARLRFKFTSCLNSLKIEF